MTKSHLGAALAVAVLSTATVAVAAVPANADPVGQCPPGPGWTMVTADFSPVTAIVDAAGNQDGYVCRLPFRVGANLGSGNLTDNNIPLHVTF